MSNRLDTVGIGVSGLCLAHCLLLPLAAIVAPTIGILSADMEWAHVALLCTAFPVSVAAFWLGMRRHKCYRVSVFAVLGLSLMAAGIVFPGPEWMETALTVTGVICLASGHLINRRLTRALPWPVSSGTPRKCPGLRSSLTRP